MRARGLVISWPWRRLPRKADACGRERLGLFVAGALDPAEAEAVAAHVATCAACAAALAEEARLEEQLLELGRERAQRRRVSCVVPGPTPRAFLPRSRGLRLTMALAAAAAAAVALFPAPRSPVAPPPDRLSGESSVPSFNAASLGAEATLVSAGTTAGFPSGGEVRGAGYGADPGTSSARLRRRLRACAGEVDFEDCLARRAGLRVRYDGALGTFPHFEARARPFYHGYDSADHRGAAFIDSAQQRGAPFIDSSDPYGVYSRY